MFLEARQGEHVAKNRLIIIIILHSISEVGIWLNFSGVTLTFAVNGILIFTFAFTRIVPPTSGDTSTSIILLL